VSVAIGGLSQQTSASQTELDDPFADPLA